MWITSASFAAAVHAPLRAGQGVLLLRLRPFEAAAHHLLRHLDRPATLLEVDLAAAAAGVP